MRLPPSMVYKAPDLPQQPDASALARWADPCRPPDCRHLAIHHDGPRRKTQQQPVPAGNTRRLLQLHGLLCSPPGGGVERRPNTFQCHEPSLSVPPAPPRRRQRQNVRRAWQSPPDAGARSAADDPRRYALDMSYEPPPTLRSIFLTIL